MYWMMEYYYGDGQMYPTNDNSQCVYAVLNISKLQAQKHRHKRISFDFFAIKVEFLVDRSYRNCWNLLDFIVGWLVGRRCRR